MFDTNSYRELMEAVIVRFKENMKKVRTGRAHPDMLAGVKVEAYGQWMPLNQVANVTAQGATMLLVTPYDPSTIQNISTAIRNDSTLNLNPSDDGHVVRVPVPALTEEARKDIVKIASKEVENSKIAIRNIREDARRILNLPNFLKILENAQKKKSMTLQKNFPIKLIPSSKQKKPRL